MADVEGGAVAPQGGVSRFDVGPRGALIAVSDGMGGHKAGEVASSLTLETLYRALSSSGSERTDSSDSSDSGARIKAAVEEAHENVAQTAGQRPSLSDMGATLTAILIDGLRAHVAEVGDSRAYLLRGGELRQLTEDQNMAQAMVTAGQLSAEEAKTSPLSKILIQAMGHTPQIRVAVGTLELRARDLLVLCSDGLTSYVSDDELRQALLSSPSLDGACERLVQMANERGGSDNITVVLAGVSGDVPALSPGERISTTYKAPPVSVGPPGVGGVGASGA